MSNTNPDGLYCWKGCNWIGNTVINEQSSPYFRKRFVLAGHAVEGVVYLCGIGYHEIYVNGLKAGDSFLTPPQSLYDKTVYYNEYDITGLLLEGDNEIFVLLGNGLYNSFDGLAWNFDTASWRDRPKLLLFSQIVLHNGISVDIRSGPDFETGESKIIYNLLHGGETQDFTQPDPMTEKTNSYPASIVKGPGGALSMFNEPLVKEHRRLKPISSWDIPNRRTMFDFGCNIAGWVYVNASSKEKTRIVIRYAEKLDENGQLDWSNIACFPKLGRFQTDEYIFDQDHPLINTRPHFTYHGFRYIELEIREGSLANIDVEAVELHSDVRRIGDFECSDPSVNSIYKVAQNATLSNLVNVPTDCPQREKNGWTGDAAVSAEQMCINYDMRRFFCRWLKDIRDSQRPSGQLAGVVPCHWFSYNWGCGPAWDNVLFELPMAMYRCYGDIGPLSENYGAMRKYMAFCESMSEGYMLDFGLGDWCPPRGDYGGDCPTRLTDTAYYFHFANVMSFAAGLLGYCEDRVSFKELSERIKAAFLHKYLDSKLGCINVDHQTAQAAAIYFGLVDEDVARSTASRLVELIQGNEGYLNFGILGAKFTFEALSRHGFGQVAFNMALKEGFPSYRHWVDMGATAMPETWNMRNSNNHHMFSDICRWFIQFIAGLQFPNFENKTITFTPDFPQQLIHAKAHTETSAGNFSCRWDRKDANIVFSIKIPNGFIAELALPPGYSSQKAGASKWIILYE